MSESMKDYLALVGGGIIIAFVMFIGYVLFVTAFS